MTVSRIAPTPSGFLHIGNIYSFVLTWLYVKRNNGKLILRIDDLDRERFREEYLDNIFKTLEWLGLDYTGPSSIDEFYNKYSQHNFLNEYHSIFSLLKENNSIYSCICSRKEIISNSDSNNQYNRNCFFNPERTLSQPSSFLNWRIYSEKNPIVSFYDQFQEREFTHNINFFSKDFIVWRKSGLPSYQLASVMDDLRLGVNCIIRGKDLLNSTLAQLYLGKVIDPLNNFNKTQFAHHNLIFDKKNKLKLSKSTLKGNVLPIYKTYTKSDFLCLLTFLLGIENKHRITKLEELLTLNKINYQKEHLI